MPVLVLQQLENASIWCKRFGHTRRKNDGVVQNRKLSVPSIFAVRSSRDSSEALGVAGSDTVALLFGCVPPPFVGSFALATSFPFPKALPDLANQSSIEHERCQRKERRQRI